MNRLARRRDANLLPRGLDSSSQLHQFILSCCMLFTIHCGHRPPHIRREGPTINPVLFERDDPSDLVDVTVARRHSSEREREGAKIRKAKYLTQLFTKWSIFVCNCEAVTCYLFYNGRVARGPDPTKKLTHVPETFRAEQSRGAICFASPWITLLPNPNVWMGMTPLLLRPWQLWPYFAPDSFTNVAEPPSISSFVGGDGLPSRFAEKAMEAPALQEENSLWTAAVLFL